VVGAAEHAAMQPAVRGLDYLDTDNPAQVLHCRVACTVKCLPCILVESTERDDRA